MRLSLIFLASALALPALADVPPPPSDGVLSCQAPFHQNATEQDLVAVFGKENVEYKSVPGAEGMETNATVIYPNDPARMLTVHWWDEDQRARPAAISVQADFAADPEGMDMWKTDVLWRTPEGLRIGSDIAAAEAINGKPFKLSGFGWDYGGFVISWEGGALDAEARGGCGMLVRYAPSGTDIPDGAYGDTELMSNSPEVTGARPRVTEFSISYPMD